MKFSFLGRLTAAIVVAGLTACSSNAPQSGNQQGQLPANFGQSEAGQQGPSKGDPRSRAKIHTELGSLYYQAGNPAAALDHLTSALEIDPEYFPAYSVRGLVYASLREQAKAEADFRRALDRSPDDPEVNNNYGWFLCSIGKESQSISYFLNALKNPLYETPDRAYANAGTCALKAGDLDGAQRYLLQAVQLSRDGAMQARYQLARLFYQRGILGEAKIYLSDALRMMEPPTAEALWLGIRLEHKLGDRLVESSYISQLRTRYPTSPEYQEFLKGQFE